MALGIPIMVQGYSSGAPEGECSSMTPRHHVDPQKSAMPYYISFDKKQIKAGETVTVNIRGKSDDDTIKGLLVQARVGDTPIGFFDPSPSSQYIQTLDCGSRGVSWLLTHNEIESAAKNEVWSFCRVFTDRNGLLMFFLRMDKSRDLIVVSPSLNRMPLPTRSSTKEFTMWLSSGLHQEASRSASTSSPPSPRTAACSGSLRSPTRWSSSKLKKSSTKTSRRLCFEHFFIHNQFALSLESERRVEESFPQVQLQENFCLRIVKRFYCEKGERFSDAGGVRFPISRCFPLIQMKTFQHFFY